MARFKDFGAPVDAENAEKLVFKIYDEEFQCHPFIQGKVVLELASMTDSEDTSESATALLNFFKRVLVPESHEKFVELAEDPKRIVPVSTLAEIVEWLVSEYTDRPTQGSEHSPSGE